MIDFAFWWPILRDALSWILFLLGSASVLTGAIGLLRFPDFYTRMHAAGITDTGGAELMILAMMLQSPTWLIAAKLAFIAVFLFFTSPTSTHALAHAAHIGGLRPLLGPDLKREDEQ